MQTGSSVWKARSKDIRDVLKIAKLSNPADRKEDVTRPVDIPQKVSQKLARNIIDHSDVARMLNLIL
ncbi:MAG TPA: hypothetical protein VE593_13080 [Nitrososphaeraceae archaeon]|nr:hypothetical protein [Nitrososphaeraceae archaeon]